MNIPLSYLELVKEFPVRPIRSKREYGKALAIAQRLSIRYESLDKGQRDYLEAISRFISDWEAVSETNRLTHLSPRESLQFLVDEHNMSIGELGRILGSQSAASMVLNGTRDLSKSHIIALAKHFQVGAALFLGCDVRAKVA